MSTVTTAIGGDHVPATRVRREAYAPPLHDPASSISKRAFDIAASLFAIILFLPLFGVLAAAIHAESGGPVIFRQRRTGLNGRVFTIYKLRTMRVAEDGGAVRQATRNDDRVTLVGGVLRKLSLDELPQLFNILKGDMSIVGPRPHALAHDAHFTAQLPEYAERFHTRPGLTGYAQVNGFRGEVRGLEGMADRIAADKAYIHEWSFSLDVLIVLKTLPLLLRDPRAY